MVRCKHLFMSNTCFRLESPQMRILVDFSDKHFWNKAFRERQHPSAPRSVNEYSLANRLETVRVSHWPITWPIYLPPWPKVNPIVHPTSYLTHIPFIPSESTLPFLSYSNFNILPWKFTIKVMGEVKVWSHEVSLTFYRLTSLSFPVNQASHSWHTTFFKNSTLKSKVKDIYEEEVKIESHIMGPTFYRLTSLSFHVNRPSHSWDTAFSFFFALKFQGQGHGWGERWKSQHGSNILSTHIPFIPCHSVIPFLRYNIFKIWPWKSKVTVMGEVDIESHMGPTFCRLSSL